MTKGSPHEMIPTLSIVDYLFAGIVEPVRTAVDDKYHDVTWYRLSDVLAALDIPNRADSIAQLLGAHDDGAGEPMLAWMETWTPEGEARPVAIVTEGGVGCLAWQSEIGKERTAQYYHAVHPEFLKRLDTGKRRRDAGLGPLE